MSQARIQPGYQGLATACGELPPWISRRSPTPAPRMLCVRRAGHPGKHANAQDHRWEPGHRHPNREKRR